MTVGGIRTYGNAPFAIWDRDPQTGQRKSRLAYSLSAKMVIDYLSSGTGLTSEGMARYLVEDANGRLLPAENWMEQMPVEHVRSVWASAHENLKSALATLWPELHTALVNLEVNGGD